MIRDRRTPLERLAEAQIRVRDLRAWSPDRAAESRAREHAESHQRELDRVELAYLWTFVAGRVVWLVAALAFILLALEGRVSIPDLPVLWK